MSGIFGERVKEAALSLLFPRRCPVCGEIVMPKGQRICPPCVKKLDFVREPRCMKCGRSIDEEGARYCHSCETRERHFERNLALLFYDDRMRRSMAAVKYHHKKEYLAPLGHLLALKFSEELRRFAADCLLPVPLHSARRRARGFNQAEELALELARETGIPLFADVLLREKKDRRAEESRGGCENPQPDSRLSRGGSSYKGARDTPRDFGRRYLYHGQYARSLFQGAQGGGGREGSLHLPLHRGGRLEKMRVFLGARLDSAPGMRYSDSAIKDERSFFFDFNRQI